MTPIQRISEKSQALDILRLGKNATTADIRTAFKFLVQEKHPDYGRGTSEEFAQINEAYQFLKTNAKELGIRESRETSRSINPRPCVKPTETVFSDAVLDECRSCIDDSAERAQHVFTMLHRLGRKLTYFVPTAPANGANDVVVPTGELVDHRRALPQVVAVNTSEISAGVYDVPDETRDALFPGARSVQIRFGS